MSWCCTCSTGSSGGERCANVQGTPTQGLELSWCSNGAACSPAAHVCGPKSTELSLREVDKTFPVGNANALCPSCLALWPWPLELLLLLPLKLKMSAGAASWVPTC